MKLHVSDVLDKKRPLTRTRQRSEAVTLEPLFAFFFRKLNRASFANRLTKLDENFRGPCQYQYVDGTAISAQSVEHCGSYGNFSKFPFVILSPSPPSTSSFERSAEPI